MHWNKRPPARRCSRDWPPPSLYLLLVLAYEAAVCLCTCRNHTQLTAARMDSVSCALLQTRPNNNKCPRLTRRRQSSLLCCSAGVRCCPRFMCVCMHLLPALIQRRARIASSWFARQRVRNHTKCACGVARDACAAHPHGARLLQPSPCARAGGERGERGGCEEAREMECAGSAARASVPPARRRSRLRPRQRG